jgi:hypothetical protein
MQPLVDLGVRQSPGDFAQRLTLTVGERVQGGGRDDGGLVDAAVKASIRRRSALTGRRRPSGPSRRPRPGRRRRRGSPAPASAGLLPIFTFCPGIRCRRGRSSRLLREVRCTWRGPLLYLSCTCEVPGSAFPAGPGPCPAAARRWSANRFHLHAARERGNLPGVRRPRAGRFPASPLSRPASACLAPGAEGRRPGFRGWGRERSAELADPFSRVREPAALPRRQLICLLIRIPADSGVSWRR